MSEYLRNQIVQKMLGEPKQSPARMPPARQAADTQPSSGSGPLGAAEVDAANALGAAYYQYPGYFKKGQGGARRIPTGKTGGGIWMVSRRHGQIRGRIARRTVERPCGMGGFSNRQRRGA